MTGTTNSEAIIVIQSKIEKSDSESLNSLSDFLMSACITINQEVSEGITIVILKFPLYYDKSPHLQDTSYRNFEIPSILR